MTPLQNSASGRHGSEQQRETDSNCGADNGHDEIDNLICEPSKLVLGHRTDHTLDVSSHERRKDTRDSCR
eukprot:CAMPEP_0181217156 /NCGR_PEP_ID=MMETSP1096-20121128/26992_1 /TAXON_ID=156174 ORGANISM="Chrysochromulina ericina, Strain CCMP281" /NCGR_SAMPLE_ID=MMETSP1096 /ASSEMBLY_ACC=CAM_ASM_000453 /LENGTH=69 /DNA_ID=CAMNT_0023309251 /DNA_START=669 /DNA_END=878 /DNA_ORIENTATION=+